MAKQIHHGHDPILRYCASNAIVVRDAAGNIKPDKEKAVAHIDGVVALVMAMSRLIAQKAPDEGSYLDGQGVVALG